MLNDFYKKYQSYGLVIVGISTDVDGASAVKDFTKELPLSYPIFLATEDVTSKFGEIWGLPTTFFYDKTGKLNGPPLTGIQEGREYFEKRIQQILKN